MREPTTRARVVKPADVRRRELLNAAIEVLQRDGLEHATVAEITRSAGVAKGTFYLHFRSKDELLDALRHRLVEQFAERVGALDLPPRTHDWPAFTALLVRTVLEMQVEVRDLHALLVGTTHRHDGELDAHGMTGNPAAMALAAVVEAGIAAGAYRVADVEATVRLLYELLHAAGEWACDAPSEFDRINDATAEMVARALLG